MFARVAFLTLRTLGTVSAILSIGTLRFNSRIFFANEPIAVLTDMRCETVCAIFTVYAGVALVALVTLRTLLTSVTFIAFGASDVAARDGTSIGKMYNEVAVLLHGHAFDPDAVAPFPA